MRELMEQQMAVCKARVEAGEELMPHFVAWDREGTAYVIATPWGDEEEKVLTLRLLKTFFLWKGVERYVMVSEAWVVVRSPDSTDHREPRNCEDRQEVITMMGVSRKEVLACNALIATDGAVRAVAETVWNEGGTSSGRMADLLPPEGAEVPPAMVPLLERFFAGTHIG